MLTHLSNPQIRNTGTDFASIYDSKSLLLVVIKTTCNSLAAKKKTDNYFFHRLPIMPFLSALGVVIIVRG